MELSLMELFTIGGGSFAAGYVVDRVVSKIQAKKRQDGERALIRTFGNLSTFTTFSFDEVMDWIESHDELMQNGCDALVLKANNETLKLVNQKFDINFNKAKYLVVAIVKNQKDIQASFVVKYDNLDKRLENELAPGNGTLIIKGSNN